MAELLIYYKDHWFEGKTPEEQAVLNANGTFDKRFVKGDFIELRESGFWLDNNDDSIVRGWNLNTFVVIKVLDKTKEQLEDKAGNWRREVSFSLDSSDDETGVYDYTIELINLSTSELELFGAKDLFNELPIYVSLLEKQSDYVRLRLDLPDSWSTEKKTEKRLKFQQKGKMIIKEFFKIVRKSRHYIDLDSIPQAYKDKLAADGWAKVYWNQLLSYIMDKKDGDS